MGLLGFLALSVQQRTDMTGASMDHALGLTDQWFQLKAHMKKKIWLPCLFMMVAQGATAQSTPSAGGQLQQIPRVPEMPAKMPPVQVAPPITPSAAPQSGTVFVVKQLNVMGATAYSVAELQSVAGFESGREISLPTLYEMAEKITNHYRQDGYLVARAYVPAQEVKDGAVTITVLEGKYGQVALNNTSSLDSQVPSNLMTGLKPGDVIEKEALEERLLRLSDLPGVEVRSTLVPGASVGLSDLIVEVKPGALISGSVDIDNAGNRYTGENRIGATVHLNNPTGHGDVATLRALTSGSGLRYGRVAYQTPWGLGRIGLAYSELRYDLGHQFEALNANGQARIATIFGDYPLIRSRNTNLYMGLTLEAKDFEDRLDAIPYLNEKKVQVATATLRGDHRDAWWGGGLNNYSLAWSTGHLDIHTPVARALDAETARTDGHYNKLAWAVSRVQQVTPTVTVLASLNGQMASKNLDVSEKMELGGMYGVRAYPEGEAYADEGYLATVEVRKRLDWPSLSNSQIHVSAFIDAGAVKLNHSPWAAGDNRRQLSGAGLGAYWTKARDFSIKAFYAWKLGSEDALSAPDKSGRFWIQAVKYF